MKRPLIWVAAQAIPFTILSAWFFDFGWTETVVTLVVISTANAAIVWRARRLAGAQGTVDFDDDRLP